MAPAKKPAIVTPLPLTSPELTVTERRAVAGVLTAAPAWNGERISAFEENLRSFTGSKYAIAVTSGMAGLHLCVWAAGIEPGDLVITTPFSSVDSTNVLIYEGAVPVFVDVEPRTGNIDPHLVFAAAQDVLQGGKNTQAWLPPKGAGEAGTLKAILPVDVFGHPADLEPILNTAWKYKLKVIENASEALGSSYKGHPAGTLGDYGVFEFSSAAQLTTGEGGMIITDEDEAANLMYTLRNQGRFSEAAGVLYTHLGYNYHLDEVRAALGLAQMQRISELIAKRSQVAEWYNQRLVDLPGIEIPRIANYTTRMSWFAYVVRFDQNLDPEAIAGRLAELSIPTRLYYPPIHLQPYIVERFGYRAGTFPVAEELAKRSLALPFSGGMDEEQVERVCQALRKNTT